MKRLLLIVLPLLLMVGCEDKKDDTTEPVNPLISVYNLTSVSVSIQSNPVQTLTFNHDGSNTYVVMILGDPDAYSFQGKIDFWGNVTNAIGTWSYDDGSCCGGYPKLILLNTNITTSNLNTEIWDLISSLDDTNYLIMSLSQPETDTTWGLLKTYTFEKEE